MTSICISGSSTNIIGFGFSRENAFLEVFVKRGVGSSDLCELSKNLNKTVVPSSS